MPGSLREQLGVKELKTKDGNLWRSFVAEFIGNLLLNFFGCASCVNIALGPAASGNIIQIALSFGLAVFMIVSTIGHMSGGHVNPAVTLGLLATGKITIIRAVLYVIAQCAGSTAGSGILKALTPESVQGTLGLNGLGLNVTLGQGVAIEFFLGFVLILVIFGVCDPHKNDAKACLSLAIGLTVTLGHLAAVQYTGAAMNPARAFGSAVIANVWDNQWIYWVGPISGGIAAALLYTHVLAASKTERYAGLAQDEKELRHLGGGNSKQDP